ncbi:MAG: type 2 isopentenyl-diphosphate Delta-isomerase [Porticoccaceae bacterium]|nr:MAG: type 2 isopentenyl-diphosphate Delta-isomerase [SAR92 bacterium MED-G29]
MTDIRQRKDDHINLALDPQHQRRAVSSFDQVCFEHNPIPELKFSDIDITTSFLGKILSAPIIIGAMTGGSDRGEIINQHLAEAALECNIPMALGSQRAALELGLDQKIRRWAPQATILSNIGATQLQQHGPDLAVRAMESVEANAVMIHLNPLQELIQPDGDRDWQSILDIIQRCCEKLPVPVIVKEVGSGIGPTSATKLIEAGVSFIETAGRGGTSWASIELARNNSDKEKQIAEPFLNWGLDTVAVLGSLNQVLPSTSLIGSGGVRHGLDVARCLRLGADMAALAQPFLKPALESTDSVINKITILSEQLRWALFLTGSRNLDEVKVAPLFN